MRAICILNDSTPEAKSLSIRGFDKLSISSMGMANPFIVESFWGVTPHNVQKKMDLYNLKWKYPDEMMGRNVTIDNPIKDLNHMIITGYRAQDQEKVKACALSHYELWKHCANSLESFIILEHDAVFIRRFDYLDIAPKSPEPFICSLNDPRGNTRKGSNYNIMLQSSQHKCVRVPMIDDDWLFPQGLPGNSAYFITPSGAEKMLELVDRYGLWPNDAIMCAQLFDGLYASTTYYTTTQRLPSTTTS